MLTRVSTAGNLAAGRRSDLRGSMGRAYAKDNPDKLSYGSPGVGTPHPLGMELLKAPRIDITHIPYKIVAQATTDRQAACHMITVKAIAEAHLKSG